MAKEEISEDVLYKTHTAIEKLPDGTCVKRVTETRNGKTAVKEEKVDCESALSAARGSNGKGEVGFTRDNEDFDNRMRAKLSEMNKSFSNKNDPTMSTKEEIYTDGSNKTMKVTRESSSIEETKKTEKIPDGTKRSLKITRESFLEETKKKVSPESLLPEDLKEKVNILDESFKEEAKDNSENEVAEGKDSNRLKENDSAKAEDSLNGKTGGDLDEYENDDGIFDDERTDGNMELVESDDSFLTKLLKSVLKMIFYPLYALNIL